MEFLQHVFSWRLGNTDQVVVLNGILEPYIDYLCHAYSTLHVLPPLKYQRNVFCEKKNWKKTITN